MIKKKKLINYIKLNKIIKPKLKNNNLNNIEMRKIRKMHHRH